MEPRVNILLPTFEPNPEHLRAAIESVRDQTEQRWTLFIHDDASTTDVRAIVEPYLSDPCIHFARSPKRRGIGGDWKATMRGDGAGASVHTLHTHAPCIQFLFQDDRWEPLYLERVLAVMQKHADVGCVVAEHHYAFEGESAVRSQYEALAEFRRTKIAPGKQDGMAFLRWWMQRGLHPNVIGEPSFVILKRELVERVGAFDDTMPQFLDVEFWTRMLPQTIWYHLPDDLGTFRVHRAGASERNRIEGRGLFDRLRCMERVYAREILPRERTKMRHAIEEQLAAMIVKFRMRKESGGAVQSEGKVGVIRFALRHPIMMLRAWKRSRKSSILPS